MKMNANQAEALRLLTKKLGKMELTEGKDTDGTDYVECYCSILENRWIINQEGECFSFAGTIWINADGQWAA